MATATVMSGLEDPLGNGDELEDFPSDDEYEGQDDGDLPQCKIKRNYSCPECSYFTQNPRFYLHHLKTVHQQKLRIYECPNCLYASRHSQKLQRHMQMVHVMGVGKKKANGTDRAVLKARQDYSPAEDAEFDDDLDTNEDSECFVSSESKSDEVFKCTLCPFTSRVQTLVKRHEKVHSKKKLFRCSKCNYVTHMKARFTKHVKYHSMPMIKCEVCDFKTPYKWNLDRHMKNHMGDGPFKCSACNFTAEIKQSLTVHEMNHHVPPVGNCMASTPARRKNRVGASDSHPPMDVDQEDLNQHAQMHAFNELALLNEIEITKNPDNPSLLKKPIMKRPNSIAQFNAKELTVKIGEKVVNPGDVIQHKNGTVYVKKLKCRVCNYRAAWESEMLRHEQRVHGLDEKKTVQKLARPIPNLIPIQNKVTGGQQSPAPPPPPPPPIPILQQQSRPMLQPKPVMHQMHHHPHFQQNMNHHPFLSRPLHSQYPQTHNLPPQYPQHLHSRFAQPKHVAQKVNKKPFQMNHSPQKSPAHKLSPPPPAILKIPTPTKMRNSNTPPTNVISDKTMTEKDLNDICAKSCPNSSLKDFASLMGGDEAFKPDDIPTKRKEISQEEKDVSNETRIEDGTKSPETMKKKNSSFFDQLKEKFGAGESCNLICNLCGHESKCLSESLRHQKTHNIQTSGNNISGGTVFSGADLSSTRCQYCRQRCKTSADLLVHLKSCVEANKTSSELQNVEDEEEEYDERVEGNTDKNCEADEDCKSEEGYDDTEDANPPHPMENKVFVWTNMANGEEDGLDDEYECGSQSPNSDCVFGIETAPGIGAVTSKFKDASFSQGNATEQVLPTKEAKPKPDNSVKKVYKCPHCSFWASTASRFHVHIVGHLNKKPFECSLCCYRSNWRWDITKHIRLKTVRDSTHQRAKVLMTDETGRRNYSKYNKYLTLMRVHEPAAESSGSGLRGKKVTQSFEPIETIPSPPKLTPIPQASLQTSEENNGLLSNSTNGSTQFRTIYPKPPPLQPSLDMKRKAPDESEDEPAKKKGLLENKKTMWKCKKCLFRDSDRAVVLAHVKDHYRNQSLQGNQVDTSDEASHNRFRTHDESSLPYMCGHCHQLSQWKHVIQRHCRLKHNGDVKVILAPRSGGDESERNEEDNETDTYMCETCPYIGNSQQCLDDHMEKHFERQGATLKCYFCSFFVSEKEELMEHMSLHGEPDCDDSSSMKDEDHVHFMAGNENGEVSMNKRYRCTACPYVSNSKTQFLYHKQFHRPRGAQFQCSLCSYNVPRRHYLQQHLRLHGINTPLPKGKNFECMETETLSNIKELDTSGMAEIPLVWVSKLGSLTKMFKCRFCPHVNIRKSNIQEHEKMHAVRTKINSEGSSPLPQQQHHCPECNYICNNAGVLSSHTKVHQGLFGQICGLVDLTRSDEEQIKELNALLGREEEGPPEITPDEINKDFKETSSPQVHATPEKDYETNIIDTRVLHFCSICPARFLYPKELEIHLRFHNMQLQFQCDSCSYTARQQPHLLAHYKVHTDEYQDRTTALCEVYQISEEHPKPKIAVIVDGSEEVGPAWVVVERQRMPAKDPQNEYDLDEAPTELSQHGNRIVTKQFNCDKCPATFFKSVALQYHSTLHGGSGLHKCRVCDYSVKTYGNLIKHETVHEELEPRVKLKNKVKRPQDNIPTSGTELFKQKTEANQKVAATQPAPPPPLHIDPEFGILMHGSPEFIYPTYLKNGRLKEKRYKCHKCPSAFEKREQYKVHLSLHGSKQRYNCERCDYSVKYYANYIQHLRKHQSNDATKAERKISTDKSTDDSLADDGTEVPVESLSIDEIQPQLPISSRSAKKMQMSMADQQTMMLMQQRVISNSVSTPEVTIRCPHCPYSNLRKEGVGSHVKCHSNVKGGAFTCRFCDYTVPQQHFLREHNKLHFTPLKSCRPEAYMKCDRLELWSEPILNQEDDQVVEDKPQKVLIFKDIGVSSKENRFLPAYSTDSTTNIDYNDNKERLFINIKTGQIDTSNLDSNENSEKEDEQEKQVLEEDKMITDDIGLVLTKEEHCMEEKDDNTMTVDSEISTNEEKFVVCEEPKDSLGNKNDVNLETCVPMEVEDKDNYLLENPQQSDNEPEDSDHSEILEIDEGKTIENTCNDVTSVVNIEQNLIINECDVVSYCDLNESHTEVENIQLSIMEQESNAEEVTVIIESQGGSIHLSDKESGDKSDKKSSSGSSASDSEDSSSDSSSTSGDSDDSSSSSGTSSQQP